LPETGQYGQRVNSSGSSDNPRWLNWCQQLQAIAQNGLTFAKDSYDIERYHQIRQIAAEMLADASGLPPTKIHGLLENDAGYATPKVDVRGVVFRDGKLLLVREKSDGCWTLPGGWADIGQSPAESVEREIWEESGYTVHAEKILAVFDRAKHPHQPAFAFHVYKMFIRYKLIGGEAKLSSETDAVDFFCENEIPPLSNTRVIEAQIKRMFVHHRQPDLPTDFDMSE
jgi:ADP-ribose pyrophosphatase YjhB (NUDIX family)